jgi:SpoVK/Ycf46/Vps4 family AAA+-type ATPase
VTHDEAIVHLVRLGLKGETRSVLRLAKKLMRDSNLRPDAREQLSVLLASAPDASPLRWANAASVDQREPRFLVTNESAEQGVAVADAVPILAASVTSELEHLVAERERARELEAAGLVPTRTLLLTGPPGVGKTMTATYLAERLGLALHRVDLSVLMSSYLGKTGQNLQAAIAEARSEPSVLLIDEFDSIAKRRDDPTDIGELKRIVNVLLLELERWPSNGLLVAATNHPELLDRAVWRRFERVITLGVPDVSARKAIFVRELARHRRSLDEGALSACVAATDGASASELVTIVRAAIRRAVLAGEVGVGARLLEGSMQRLVVPAATDDTVRALYCQIANSLGLTHRDIAATLNISHVTVGRVLQANTKAQRKARVKTKAKVAAKRVRRRGAGA